MLTSMVTSKVEIIKMRNNRNRSSIPGEGISEFYKHGKRTLVWEFEKAGGDQVLFSRSDLRCFFPDGLIKYITVVWVCSLEYAGYPKG